MLKSPSRRARAVATAVVLGLVAGPLAALAPAGAELPDRTDDGRPPRDVRSIEVLNVSHRGEVRGTTQPPENTLAAIAEAIRVGADAVEVDVTPTADDELVLMHDRTLDRTTDAEEVFGPGPHETADYTLAQLKTLSAGTFDGEVQRIPTLGEVLELIRGRTALLIDTKYDHGDTDIEALIAAELQAQPDFDEWGPDTVSFGSYGWTSLQTARSLLPDLELTFIMNYLCVAPNGVIVAGDLPPDRQEGIPGVTPGETTIDEFIDILVDGGISTVGIFALSTYKGTTASCADNDFTPNDVQRFADAGILFSQNAEDPASMQDRIDRGVRAILTDHPDTLATVLPAPPAPTEVAATAGDASATVTWTAPDPYVGSRRTGYVVTASPGDATGEVTVEAGPDATSVEVTGLPNGTAQTFTVQAVNFAGAGEVSAPSAPITPVAAPTDDERYVDYLYRTLLGRPADPGGLAHWSTRVAEPGGRHEVAGRLSFSSEANRGRTVRRMYQDWLGRDAEPAARGYWGERLDRGELIWRVEVTVLASPEMYAKAGGTDDGWVRALYPAVLGRPADQPGVDHFVARLARGQTRATVASMLLQTDEALRARIDRAHHHVLDRPSADDADAAMLRRTLRSTRDIRYVEIHLAASDEAYALASDPR